jgi:hypothetical protein
MAIPNTLMIGVTDRLRYAAGLGDTRKRKRDSSRLSE